MWHNMEPAFTDIERCVVAMAHHDCIQKNEAEIKKAIDGTE